MSSPSSPLVPGWESQPSHHGLVQAIELAVIAHQSAV